MKPVAEVIQDHAATLLATEGVVGLYSGKLEDGRTCVRVAVAVRTPEVEARIPAELDGYPVLIVETGPIVPL